MCVFCRDCKWASGWGEEEMSTNDPTTTTMIRILRCCCFCLLMTVNDDDGRWRWRWFLSITSCATHQDKNLSATKRGEIFQLLLSLLVLLEIFIFSNRWYDCVLLLLIPFPYSNQGEDIKICFLFKFLCTSEEEKNRHRRRVLFSLFLLTNSQQRRIQQNSTFSSIFSRQLSRVSSHSTVRPPSSIQHQTTNSVAVHRSYFNLASLP